MCSLCWLAVAKNHNFWQILTFWGAPVMTPFSDEGRIWCAIADPRHTLCAKFRFDWFILSPSGNEKPQFLPYFQLRHLVMSPFGSNLRKLSTVHNYKPSPIQLYQNRFCTPMPSWRNWAQTLMLKSVTDIQTHRQTKKLHVFGH